ncbi:MAG: ABC transporter permease [Defluviitaleaceae bacterium]|nr:ABC transporter permease [Defluviitaleaceae bacterium]
MQADLTFFQKTKAFVKRSPTIMAVVISFLLYGFTVFMVPTAFNIGAISTIFMLALLLSFASAGQTMVLIGGGLDFTVGAVMSCAALITTTIMYSQDGRVLPALISVLALGAAVGLVNGICTVKIGLPALVVTMAIGNVLTQLTFAFLGGNQGRFAGPAFIQSIVHRFFGFIPAVSLYALIVFPLVFYILYRSRFGRQLYLVGNNPEAARLTGINVNRVKILSYVISGMFSGFTGMLGAGLMQTARNQMFDEYAYNSLIAVIVGGTSFAGGIGNYTGTIAGSLLMVVLNNMLTALQLSQPVRNIMLGAVLVLLLVMYNRRKSVRQ